MTTGALRLCIYYMPCMEWNVCLCPKPALSAALKYHENNVDGLVLFFVCVYLLNYF